MLLQLHTQQLLLFKDYFVRKTEVLDDNDDDDMQQSVVTMQIKWVVLVLSHTC